MSSFLMKKSLQFISGKKLGKVIKSKVTQMGEFASSLGLTRQYINRIIKKEKFKMDEETLEKLKDYLNITFEEIRYDPRETESKQNGTTLGDYPVSSSILEELEICRKDLAHWRGLAQEYEMELNRLRGQQK